MEYLYGLENSDMNYLAHLALSGNDPGVMVGNFIGDYVKGKRFERYRPAVQTGILLHRTIDAFTDAHPVFRESCALIYEAYGRYSPVVMDVIYDHFLARNWELSENPFALSEFVGYSHRVLLRNYFRLPGEVRSFLPFLINSRRMEGYFHLNGVENALVIMSRYTSLPNNSLAAIQLVEKHRAVLNEHFMQFFPEVKALAASVLQRTDLH